MGKLLLSAGSDINAVDSHGNTPLHNSCYHNSPSFTALLISKGAFLDARSKNLDTPLDYATESGHLEIVKLLINAGVDVNLTGENGWSPLHNAASISRKIAVDVVKILLDAGANPAARSGDGQYPYQVAVNANVKTMLLEAKAQAHITESLLKEPGIVSTKDSVSSSTNRFVPNYVFRILLTRLSSISILCSSVEHRYTCLSLLKIYRSLGPCLPLELEWMRRTLTATLLCTTQAITTP